jgi:predicted esterase
MRSLRNVLAISTCAGLIFTARPGSAEKFTLATLPYQPAWCAPEMTPLGDDVCHVPGTPAPDGRRTLIIFLHGVIAKNTMWQWLQERGIGLSAREFHFDAIVPQAPRVGKNGAGGFAWPGMGKGNEEEQSALFSSWTRARKALEAKNGRPYDEVYVVGFSSGAYFATALAMRGKLNVDGYVVLAGGAPLEPTADLAHRAPVFVGVCTRDHASAPSALSLAHLLRERGWKVRVDEQPVGHGVTDVHVGHALAWLRALHDRSKEVEVAAAGQ